MLVVPREELGEVINILHYIRVTPPWADAKERRLRRRELQFSQGVSLASSQGGGFSLIHPLLEDVADEVVELLYGGDEDALVR